MTPYRIQPPAPPPLSLHEKVSIAWDILGPGIKRVGKIVGLAILGAMLVISVLYGVGWLFYHVAPNVFIDPPHSPVDFVFDGILAIVLLVIMLIQFGLVLALIRWIIYTNIVKPVLQGPIAKTKEAIKTAEKQRKRRGA
jgi:hypothetical protein